MPDFAPGDRILYRDGTSYCLARVDIVGERHVTAFSYCMTRRRWRAVRNRIPVDFIIGGLAPDANIATAAATIRRLHNQREAARQQANTRLAESIRELTRQREPA